MRIIVMSDLHLSKKPFQVRKALKMGEHSDLVLLVGDLTNDGTPVQMDTVHQCIAEVLPDTPVLAVTGNHDYPHQPSPMIREGICDFPALQDWLLKRQPYPYRLDESGAWAVRVNEIEIIGLNCVWHWRRFKFPEGAQLNWLEQHLDHSDAKWHIILCHAPLLAHNPKRSDTKPYLSRDEHLQRIIDAHKNIIFISGHTHVAMESPIGCVEFDRERRNYYINDGSIRPTTLLDGDGLPTEEPSDGNVVEILLEEDAYPDITAISTKTGERLTGSIWGDGNWDAPTTYEEVTGMLSQCYPDVIQVFLQKEGYLGHSGGWDFALGVGQGHLSKYGVWGEFRLRHLERRFFSIERFLKMLETARDRYIIAHPDREQGAKNLYAAVSRELYDRKARWEQEKMES